MGMQNKARFIRGQKHVQTSKLIMYVGFFVYRVKSMFIRCTYIIILSVFYLWPFTFIRQQKQLHS